MGDDWDSIPDTRNTDIPEICTADFEDMKMRLPKPQTIGTEKTKGLLSFYVDFNPCDVK